MKSFRDIRVIPVVLFAILGLVVLKIAGLVLDGGYVFDYNPQSARPSWAQENFNFPGGNRSGDPADFTGSVPEKPKEEKKEEKKEGKKDEARAAEPPPKPGGVMAFPEQTQQVSPSERAILERLQARRQELEARAREVEIRESLLKAAEKRIESRVEEAKATEAKISAASGHKAEVDAARFKGIITMYESMK
ncbi:MAG: MotE family protein, partial [Bradyrhizobium sp.]